MSKAKEKSKLAVKIKRLSREFNLYRKFICTDKNNEQNELTPSPLPLQLQFS